MKAKVFNTNNLYLTHVICKALGCIKTILYKSKNVLCKTTYMEKLQLNKPKYIVLVFYMTYVFYNFYLNLCNSQQEGVYKC